MAIATKLALATGAALAVAAGLGPALAAPLDGGVAQAVSGMPARTGKERLGGKASDEQRVNNCKVPLALRGTKERPDACGGTQSLPEGVGGPAAGGADPRPPTSGHGR